MNFNPRHVWRQIIQKRQAKVAFRSAISDLTTWTARDDAALNFYRHLIPLGTTCFDIGGNVGNRAKIFARLAAKTVVVEPQKLCIKVLETMLPRNSNVVLVPKAVGAHTGELEIFISKNSMLSTASTEWIEETKKNGRFGGDVWSMPCKVPMTTLDELIKEHGSPSFIKIDVEGFEFEVLKGLNNKVKSISFEFVPERLNHCYICLDTLFALGPIECNYCLNEVLQFQLQKWVSIHDLKHHLSRLTFSSSDFGDIYVRFVNAAE